MFHVGQKVVCIDDDWAIQEYQRQWVPNVPAKGAVYTISEITNLPQDYGCSLRLVELPNPIPPWDDIARFSVTRFRPVVERKTDITVFEEILRNTKAPVTDDALHASIDSGQR